MSRAILDKNFQFLRGTGISIFNSEDENNTNKNENVYHYIANNLADLGYTLNDEDIIFTFSTNDDIKMILKDEDEDKNEWIKDPAGQIDTERIAILSKDNKFYEYVVSLNEPYKIFLVQITQPTLEMIQPDYTKYKQNTYVPTRQFRALDNLGYKFKRSNEMVNLYGRIVQSNKTLQEISKEFLNRLL